MNPRVQVGVPRFNLGFPIQATRTCSDLLTKNQQEHPGMRLSAQGLQQLGEQGRQKTDYILMLSLATGFVGQKVKMVFYLLIQAGVLTLRKT